MKALVVSDVVSEVLYAPDIRALCAGVGVVLSCGDLPDEYLEYIATMLGVPLLYVFGNHDRPTHRADGRTTEGPEGGQSIDGRIVALRETGGRTIWVAGFGGSAAYCGGPHEYTEREMRRRVCRAEPRLRWNSLRTGRGADVVVTHAAPRGIHDGNDPCHRGFEAFLRLMTRHRPRLLVHGHVHPSYGGDVRPRRYASTDVRSIYGHEIMEIGS
jgi:Icc-related predicted phosphoesterase